MLRTQQREAALETLLLRCGERAPTEADYQQVAAAYGCHARTVRRLAQKMLSLAPAGTDEVGLSARAALTSLRGIDPRVVYRSEPTGQAWWPDLDVLQVVAAQPTLRHAHDQLVADGRVVPAYEHFTRRLRDSLDAAVYAGIVGLEGAPALAALQVVAQQARPARMHLVETDGFELPVDVTLPGHTRPVKPWLMLVIDRGTRAIPGWLVIPHRPTGQDFRTLLALTALGFTCEDGTVIGGVPRFILPDNGGEFRNAAADQALAALGIQRLPIPPSTPHLKGTVERAGGLLQQDLIDTLSGATHGPQLLHKQQPWRAQPMPMGELVARVDAWFAAYNTTRAHSSLGGYTPLQAWNADPTPVRPLTDAHVLRDLMPRVSRIPSKKGVILDHRHYIHPSLGDHTGERVQVAWLPRHGDAVEVFTADGTYLCTAIEATGLTDDERDQLMTTRMRQFRAVTGLLTAGTERRALLTAPEVVVDPTTTALHLETSDADPDNAAAEASRGDLTAEPVAADSDEAQLLIALTESGAA